MNSPVVSVIINNYNYASFLKDALDSVLSQTYKDWELIIVDDGSTDESFMIGKRYSKLYSNRIRFIRKENGGQASCLNIGFKESKGSILAFLDSDDFWYPNKLEKIVEAHKTHGFVSHKKCFSDERKQKINPDLIKYRSDVLKRYGVFETCDVTTSTLSITRDLAQRVFPIPEEIFRICADHFINYVASYFQILFYLSEELSYYRIHDRNRYLTASVGEKATSLATDMNKYCCEIFNKRFSDQGYQIPMPSLGKRKEMWKEYGEGFEIVSGKKYMIYGTGYESYRVSKVIQECKGIIYGFCDSNPEKQGMLHEGLKIINPSALIEDRNNYYKIIIASVNYCYDIESYLKKIGLHRGADYIYTLFL